MATGRLRGCLWLTAGLVVALLAGFVGFMTLSKAAAQRSGQGAVVAEVPVVTAAHALGVRTTLKAEDLQIRNVPVNAAPEGSLRKTEDAVGKVTTVDLYTGEIVLSQRLLDPNVVTGSGRMALLMANDQVLMAFPAADLMSKAGVLKAGDHVDLLFSVKVPANRGTGAAAASGQQDEQMTFDTLQNVTISALVAGATGTNNQNAGAPEALLMTLAPQDALVLKYVKDAGGVLDIVLRAPGAEQPFTVDPVNMQYLLNRYRVPGQAGQ